MSFKHFEPSLVLKEAAWGHLGGGHQVVVGDYDELQIPQEAHRISSGRIPSEHLNQVD
jgi:hypothetical protein